MPSTTHQPALGFKKQPLFYGGRAMEEPWKSHTSFYLFPIKNCLVKRIPMMDTHDHPWSELSLNPPIAIANIYAQVTDPHLWPAQHGTNHNFTNSQPPSNHILWSKNTTRIPFENLSNQNSCQNFGSYLSSSTGGKIHQYHQSVGWYLHQKKKTMIQLSISVE